MDKMQMSIGGMMVKKMIEAYENAQVQNEKQKKINGVIVKCKNNGNWYCDFEDYKNARKKQNRKWSEKSFCNWCDKYNLDANG